MTTYKSKISFLTLLPVLIAFLSVGLVYSYLHTWGPLIGMVLVIAFVGYLYQSTYYTVNDNKLTIHAGFTSKTDIDISKIKSIAETSSVLSAPAWPMDRIEIFYNTFDSVVISPPDKTRFIADLQAINPSIKVSLKNKK